MRFGKAALRHRFARVWLSIISASVQDMTLGYRDINSAFFFNPTGLVWWVARMISHGKFSY